MPRRPPARLACLLLLLGLATCRGGCGKKPAAPLPAAGVLDWFPADTRIVVGIDFAGLRATTLWTQLGGLATTDPGDRQKIDELARRTGFDPLNQVDMLVVAFPEEARAQGGMGMVLRGRGLDENRLIAYVRDEVAKQGDDLFSFKRAGRTLWATRKEPTTAGFFVGQTTFVLGTGGWAERMAELSAAPAPGAAPANASGNLPLVHLVERAGPARAIWAAAIVPAATRNALAADPTLPGAANVNRLALGIDLSSGVDAHLLADLSTHAEAADMARQVGEAVLAAKKSPQVLLMGVGPYLDGVTAQATDVTCEVGVRLSPAQASDGVDRLKALLALARQGAVPGFPHP